MQHFYFSFLMNEWIDRCPGKLFESEINYQRQEIKPCGLGSRIRDMDAHLLVNI